MNDSRTEALDAVRACLVTAGLADPPPRLYKNWEDSEKALCNAIVNALSRLAAAQGEPEPVIEPIEISDRDKAFLDAMPDTSPRSMGIPSHMLKPAEDADYIDQLQQEADELNVLLGACCFSHADRIQRITWLKKYAPPNPKPAEDAPPEPDEPDMHRCAKCGSLVTDGYPCGGCEKDPEPDYKAERDELRRAVERALRVLQDREKGHASKAQDILYRALSVGALKWSGVDPIRLLKSERDALRGLLRTFRGDVLCMADWCGGMEDERVMRIVGQIDAALEKHDG